MLNANRLIEDTWGKCVEREEKGTFEGGAEEEESA